MSSYVVLAATLCGAALALTLQGDNSLSVTRAATCFFLGQFHAAGGNKSSVAMHTEFCGLGASVLWHE